MTTSRTTNRPCDGSGIRVKLSVAEERRREAHCPHCDRSLSVRPTRHEGNPEATLPRHTPTGRVVTTR